MYIHVVGLHVDHIVYAACIIIQFVREYTSSKIDAYT